MISTHSQVKQKLAKLYPDSYYAIMVYNCSIFITCGKRAIYFLLGKVSDSSTTNQVMWITLIFSFVLDLSNEVVRIFFSLEKLAEAVLNPKSLLVGYGLFLFLEREDISLR